MNTDAERGGKSLGAERSKTAVFEVERRGRQPVDDSLDTVDVQLFTGRRVHGFAAVRRTARATVITACWVD